VGLYVAVAAPVFRFLQRNQRVLWPLLAAFLWTGLELVRAELGPGFPWLFLGYTQYRFSGLLQLAALGGVYAVSFVVFLVNASVAALVAAVLRGPSGAARTFPAGHCLMLAFSAALTIACAGAGYAVRDGIAMREGPVVGIVQQNIPRLVAEIFDERKTMEDVYRERESEVQVAAQLTAGLRERGVRLIVWPETTVPLPLDVPSEMFVQDRERLLQERILSYLRQLGSDMDCWFLIGAPSCLARSVTRPGSLLYGVEAREEFGNSAVFLSPQAEYVDRYDKMRLVPFGEYIPLRDVLPFLSAFTPIPRELTPGEEEVIFSLPPGEGNEPVRFGALICYEDVFADLTRSFRRKGADFLVNLTDEGWYPIPGELGQHLPMAVFRAVETRTTVVRAANTGISCFINPVGEVYERLEPWTEGALSAPLQLCDVVTPYVQYGDAFGLMCLVLAFALLAVLARSSRKRRR
ncbi:MAG: apolipoprotein N-acyltransferase, partial [Candidatus Brocadiae bacterium]|nr:apolipoprotein N-acyltransferase [Candidatus Brocadiia bacterium]